MYKSVPTDVFDKLISDLDYIKIKIKELQDRKDTKELLDCAYTRQKYIDNLSRIEYTCKWHLDKLKRRM